MTYKPFFVVVPVLAIFLGAIPTALADQNAYNFTVHVPSHAFGVNAVTIYVKTANGYESQQDVSTAQSNIYWIFNIPPNQGDSIVVCVHTANDFFLLRNQHCQHWIVNQESGSYSVSMDSP